MKTIIVKEIRENLRWALLLMLVLAAGLAYGVGSDGSKTGLMLIGPETSTVTGIALPVAGLALGLLVILQDRLRGRWGFVMHRPVSPTRIFAAKVIAGIMLYGVAGGLPLAVAVAWVATPGHVAGPFDVRMLAPLAADLFDGLLWFGAGLLIAARKARWIGTRLMPAGLAFVVAAYAWVVPFHLWQANLILALGMAFFVPSAWAAFVAGDDYERQPVSTRGLQAVCIATGLALAVGAALNLTAAGIEWAHPRANWGFEQYRVLRDGQVLISTLTRTGGNSETDLAGNPVYDRRPAMASGDISSLGFPGENSAWPRQRYVNGLHVSDAYVQPLQLGGLYRWFYVPDRRTIEGYDPRDGQFIGSIGPDGGAPSTAAAQPFPHPLYRGGYTPQDLLSSPFGVYRLDVVNQWQLRTIFAAAPGDPIIQPPALFGESDQVPSYLAIATKTQVYVLQMGDKLLCKIPLDPIDRPYGRVDIGRATNGKFVLHYNSGSDIRGGGPPDRLVVADADGKIISRTTLPKLPEVTRTEPWYTAILEVLAMPPALLTVLQIAGTNDIAVRDWITVIAAGLASAAGVAALARRYGLDQRGKITWVIFAAMAGVAGLLTLLAIRLLPARIVCPHCRRRRLVTRTNCEHCGTIFPPPAAEGIEVLVAA